MGPLQAWWDTSPDCVKHNVPSTEGVAKAFEECAGFFTWGPGRAWSEGKVVESGTVGIFTLTAIGFTVSILAFLAWVIVEHRKLRSQAERLRAAGEIHVEPGGAPPAG